MAIESTRSWAATETTGGPTILATGLAVAVLSVIAVRWLPKPVLVRRAAFDVGSGSTKLLVANVDERGTVCGHPLFEVEKPMPFKAAAQASPDGSLSEEVMRRGLELLGSLAAKAHELGTVEASGAATEVFRTAPNGQAFLDEVAGLL